jgi:hypothetical protein
MKPVANEIRHRRRTVIDAAIAFLVILLMVQMWLLTATLESYLAGHVDAALPGMLVSLALFLSCFGLYRFVIRIDQVIPEQR